MSFFLIPQDCYSPGRTERISSSIYVSESHFAVGLLVPECFRSLTVDVPSYGKLYFCAPFEPTWWRFSKVCLVTQIPNVVLFNVCRCVKLTKILCHCFVWSFSDRTSYLLIQKDAVSVLSHRDSIVSSISGCLCLFDRTRQE